MKLLYTGNSPYARRVRITLRGAGLDGQVEEISISSFDELNAFGPGGKVPMLITRNGQALCETLLITRYLNDLGSGALVPAGMAERERAMVLEATASVLMDSLFARSLEQNQREPQHRSAAIMDREVARSRRCYDALEQMITDVPPSISLADIAVVSALGYADWRASEDEWRTNHPRLLAYFDALMQRPAFAETAPVF